MNVNTKYYRYEHGPYDRQLDCYIDVLIKTDGTNNDTIMVKSL